MGRLIASAAIVLTALVVVSVVYTRSDTQDPNVDGAGLPVAEPDSTAATSENLPEPSTSAMPSDTAPGLTTSAERPEEEPLPSVPDTPEDEPATSTPSTGPDNEPEPPASEPGDLDAAALLFAAGEASVGQSVRGESTVGMSPGPEAVLARTTFETAADGNTAMTFSLFGSESMEFRVVDGSAYVQLPPELRSSLGLQTTVQEAWLTVDEASAAELGVGCASPLSAFGLAGSNLECDPLGDTASLFPEFGEYAVIVGRETLRGVPATVVRLDLPVRELLATNLASLLDSENPFGDLESMEDMLPPDAQIRIDVWIGDDLRIHRTVFDLGSLMAVFSNSGEGGLNGMPRLLATTDYYDHDAEIVVQAPPPELVVGDLADYSEPSFRPLLIDP